MPNAKCQMPNSKTKLVLLSLALLMFVITSCSLPFHRRLDTYLKYGLFDKALETIEEEKEENKQGIYKEKNEILYYFDKGAVAQMLGKYKTSTAALQEADRKIEELYTRNIGDEAWSFFSDDLNLHYRGEDFEQVMVNILKALNFMYRGNFDGARVEAKKVNNKLNYFADEYGENAIYTDDAFARYISAFAYEAIGELSEAYIDYKKAYSTYVKNQKIYGTEVPYFIKRDILRMASALGYRDDLARYKNEWGDIPFDSYSSLKKKAEMLLVIYDGLPPYKKDVNAMPEFVNRGYALSKIVVRSKHDYPGNVAEDVAKIAIKNLKNKQLAIALKTAARRVVKDIAKEVPILNLFIGKEKADTRSWRTLPARFHIVRVPMRPGKHKILVEMTDIKGKVKTETIKIKARAGGKRAVPVVKFSLDDPPQSLLDQIKKEEEEKKLKEQQEKEGK